jgi:hypothetical protein
MPLIDYKPEVLTHKSSPDKRVAALGAGDLVFALPGAQLVDRTLWDWSLKSQEYGEKLNEYIARGVLTLLDDSDKPTLDGLNPTVALQRVKDCFDLDLLTAWREDEARPTLTRALDAKIKELTPPPKKDA